MATPVVFNAVNYSIPAFGDVGYAQGPGNLSAFLIAVASGTLQPTGGLFSLTADANFGPNFGLVSKYYKTTTANIAQSGQFRLARTDTINWRNNANTLDLPLGINVTDQLTFNGIVISTAAAGGTVNPGVAGRLTLYPAAGNTVDDVYVQNSQNIDLFIATQAARTVALEYTIPNPGNAVAAATFALLELAQTFTATQTFAAATFTGLITGVNLTLSGVLTISSTANQIVLGTTNTTTITSPAPAASRVYTIPDSGGATSFIMGAGNQTIGGVKTFSGGAGAITLSASTIAMGANKITGLANGTVATDAINFGQNVITFTNVVDNGGFEIWQRGTSFSSPAVNTYTADRWKIGTDEAATVIVTKETTTIDSGLTSMKIVISGSGAGKAWYVNESIENFADYRGKTISFSARVNTNVATAFRVAVNDGGVTGLQFSSYHTGGGGWETLSMNYFVGTTASAVTLFVGAVGAGDKKNGTYYIDNAMMVISAEPVPFLPTNPQVDLSRCQRFFQVYGGIVGFQLTGGQVQVTTQANISVPLLVTMRTTPTLTVNNPTNWQFINAAGGQINLLTLTGSVGTPSGMIIMGGTVSAGLVAGNCTTLYANNANCSLYISADL